VHLQTLPRVLFCLALSTAVLFAGPLPATSSVRILVVDQGGVPLPKAKLRITAVAEKQPSELETNERGESSVQLRPGGYELSAVAVGFKAYAAHFEAADSKSVQVVLAVLQITSSGDVVPLPHDSLSLFSSWHRSVTLSRDEFKSLPHITVTVDNVQANTQETYSGVNISDLFTKWNAPFGGELRGKVMLHYVRATGSDNYQVVFSLAEIDPAFHSGEIIVADQRNGQPLDAKSGPFKLVATEDKRPARWVRNLVSLELKSAE
jgi:hypothetical protein